MHGQPGSRRPPTDRSSAPSIDGEADGRAMNHAAGCSLESESVRTLVGVPGHGDGHGCLRRTRSVEGNLRRRNTAGGAAGRTAAGERNIAGEAAERR